MQETQGQSLTSRIARQGTLLFGGFAAAQVFSFARNAIVAHWLSKGDFGIAAAILLLLQLLDTLSDLGADRLIVQARDGADARLVATAHTTLAARGLFTALVLVAVAGPMADFFGIPDARWAFAAAALVPFIKGFVNLDSRVAQRDLNNRPQIAIEVLPQAFGLALTWPALKLFGDYSAVLWLSVAQALIAVAISHIASRHRYALALDLSYLKRLVVFGWPIWASAFPLIAVYQGDRMLIGHMVGMEGLAAYTTAFMITMVPGLIAAKVANALMLPLLASEQDNWARFSNRFVMMAEATAVGSALYLVGFIISGGALLPIAFGANYAGLESLVAWLALMWSMRMLQAVPGAALLAKGLTRPFLTAGIIRATGLILAYVALRMGGGVTGAAAAGAIAEFASLAFVTALLNRLERDGHSTAERRLGTVFGLRSLLLLPAGGLALASMTVAPGGITFPSTVLVLGLVSIAVVALAAMTMHVGVRQLMALRGSKAR